MEWNQNEIRFEPNKSLSSKYLAISTITRDENKQQL